MEIKYSKFQLILEMIGAMILMAFFIFIIKSWGSIPDMVPGHYNALGGIDRWVDKTQILIMPIIGGAMYFGLTIVTFFPKIWNVPSAKTEKGKKDVYRCIKTMIILLKIEILGVFFYITSYSAQSLKLPKIFLPIELLKSEAKRS